VIFPRSFFIRPRRLNPWTVKSCRSDLRYGDARLVVHRFKLGLKRQRRNRPKYITLAFFHSAIRDTTLTLTASQAHYFQTPSLFLFCVCSFFTLQQSFLCSEPLGELPSESTSYTILGTKNNQCFDDLRRVAIEKGFEARSRTQAASRKNYEQIQSIMDQFFAFCRSMAIAKSEYQERLDIVLL
jgi:hypothetical protein